MRYLILVVVQAVLFSSLAFGAPTVFFKDGTKVVGGSIWTENNKVYLSQDKEIYEYGADEVKLDETLKYNKIGRYQVVAPDEHAAVSVPAANKQRRTKKGAVLNAVHKTAKPAVNAVAAPAAAPSVAVPAPGASAPAVVTPASKPAVPPATSASAPAAAASPVSAPMQPAKEPVPPAAPSVHVPSVPPSMLMGSGFPIAFLLIVLAVSLLLIASCWIIYERAGRAGWKCLIPFYNWYVLMEISGKPGWWMFLLFIPLVGVAIYLFAMISLARKFGRSELFGVGIFLLPMIFLPLLAFGGSRYEG